MVQPEVSTQYPDKRARNFNEVSLGFSKRTALEEARRCPQCAGSECVKACPIKVNIPGFIRSVRENNTGEALEIIKESNCFPSVCGRICSAPCEKACVLKKEDAPVAIRALERFAADYGKQRSPNIRKENNGKRIAVIGGGPSGLFAAYKLAKKGYRVTVFESLEKPGGVLRYGVPEFRLPKKVLDSDISDIKAHGVTVMTNCFFGQTVDLEGLKKEGFNAFILATGAATPKFLDIPGVNLAGVYYGEEFLMRVNLMKASFFSRQLTAFPLGKRIAVIGSGNTALDCARSALRLGREVTLVFKNTEQEMRVRTIERKYAKEEGIKFEPLTRPAEVLSDDKNFVRGLRCVRMDYAEDASGKWKLEEVPSSQFEVKADTVVIAVGHVPNSNIKMFLPGLELDTDGSVVVDAETGETSLTGIFAAGNVVTNAQPLVNALAAGDSIAKGIEQYLVGVKNE
ncbi:MAG: FAD-dependent oxidoreductase [Candidatus Omnitrophica bacterium]|nr:FAD-dependent oxidoreductase [Candidatus Omnitrophota bacterium]